MAATRLTSNSVSLSDVSVKRSQVPKYGTNEFNVNWYVSCTVIWLPSLKVPSLVANPRCIGKHLVHLLFLGYKFVELFQYYVWWWITDWPAVALFCSLTWLKRKICNSLYIVILVFHLNRVHVFLSLHNLRIIWCSLYRLYIIIDLSKQLRFRRTQTDSNLTLNCWAKISCNSSFIKVSSGHFKVKITSTLPSLLLLPLCRLCCISLSATLFHLWVLCPLVRLRFVPLTQTCQGMPIASCAQARAWQSRTDGC